MENKEGKEFMYKIEYIIFQCNDNQSLEERHTLTS
jgi:hypothetical protein